MFFTRGFLLGPAGLDLFDAVRRTNAVIGDAADKQVLLQKGCTELVERGRTVTSTGGKTKQLGKLLGKPLSRFSTVRSTYS